MNENMKKALMRFFAAVYQSGEGEAADAAKDVYRVFGGDVADLEVADEPVEDPATDEEKPSDDPAGDQD